MSWTRMKFKTKQKIWVRLAAGGELDLDRLSLDDVESSEVLQGAGSARYGSDALGGVIHIRTQDARCCGAFARVRLAYGVMDPRRGARFGSIGGGPALGTNLRNDGYGGTYDLSATGGYGAERWGARFSLGVHRQDGFDLDPEAVARAITPRTKAILPVHLFGQTADLKALRHVAGDLPIVEDAAQALGAACCEGHAGAVGAFGCFSFFPTKTLGGFGDGGLVVTGDAELAARARLLRAHGAKPKYTHHLVGGNFRLDALQAALLRVKLPHLEAWMRGRQENAAAYDEGLAGAPVMTPPRLHEAHAYHQYVIRAPRRDALRAALAEAGIGTGIYYPSPLPSQPCFAELGHAPGDFPEAERACREVLALPIFPELGAARRKRVTDAILTFYA